MKIVITEFMDETALSGFDDSFEVVYAPELVDNRANFLSSLEQADAIIVRNRTQVDLDVIQSAPNLRVIGRLGVGLDNIDLRACEARHIKVLPATGANTQSVVEYVIGTAMALIRGSYFSTQQLTEGKWPRAQLGQGGEITGRRLGLIGFGHIAQAVARSAQALGLKISAYDPYISIKSPQVAGVNLVSLETLLEHSDIVSVHTPLTPETDRIINTETITQIKQGAVLINSSRGEVVDEDAVIQALKSGQLSGAALDVFRSEPMDADTAAKFRDCPNLILTPHIAGVTAEANQRVSRITVENVARALREYQ